MDREFGISRCQLVYIGRINNKILPYSTENYIHYPGTHYDGKECENTYIYIYIYINVVFYYKEEMNVTL